jgi:uncharacterized protein (DUF342 family)
MNEKNEEKIYTNSTKNLTIKISEDNLSAYLTFDDDIGMIDEKEITKLINTAGITSGFDEAKKLNEQNNIRKEINIPFLIAKGANPLADSEITYQFDKENCYNPEVSYDIYKLDSFEKIRKHQVIAELKITNVSEPGLDIFGNQVSSGVTSSLNVDNLLGDNVYYAEEENRILTLKDGYPFIDSQNKLHMKSDFFINENIIDKDLKIYGDVTIDGVITNSRVEIIGNLRVKGNISDCKNKGVFVDGDVNIEYAENAMIVCNGTLTINKNVRFCNLHSEKKIIGEEDSSIAGCLLQCGNNITLSNIGSPFSMLTEIEITASPYLKEMIRSTQDKLEKARNNPDENEEIIPLLSSELREMEEDYEKITDELLLDELTDFHIAVYEKVYPETRVRIFKHSKLIGEELGNVIFSVKDNQLLINEVDRKE